MKLVIMTIVKISETEKLTKMQGICRTLSLISFYEHCLCQVSKFHKTLENSFICLWQSDKFQYLKNS